MVAGFRLLSKGRQKGAGADDQRTERSAHGGHGFEATGKLRAEDYRDVVLPALERASAGGDVRFVVVIPEFHGMSGGALWQDLKLGIEHLRAWKRVALVTDIEWMHLMTTLFGWMTPGEVRHFPLAQRDEAIDWAAT